MSENEPLVEKEIRYLIADIEERQQLLYKQIQDINNQKVDLKNQLFSLRWSRGVRP